MSWGPPVWTTDIASTARVPVSGQEQITPDFYRWLLEAPSLTVPKLRESMVLEINGVRLEVEFLTTTINGQLTVQLSFKTTPDGWEAIKKGPERAPIVGKRKLDLGG